jgi:hypothetical protein
VYVRVYGIDREKLQPLLATLRTHGELRYLVDHTANRREIFE